MKPVTLIIRDGWGINPLGFLSKKQDGNATLLANTPFHNDLFATYPMSHISASGEDVGLPSGQMGNSEVGHMNLGAGRIVYQDLARINKAISSGKLADNENLQNFLFKLLNAQKACEANSQEKRKCPKLHLIGLVSDGGVHSHQNHLVALAQCAKQIGVKNIIAHAITDGRDTSPTGAVKYLSSVEDELAKCETRIATVVGRYYAMDRDKRWERVKVAWDAIVHGKAKSSNLLPSEEVAAIYEEGKTDEFMPARVFDHANSRRVNKGDFILFFNFRADRARQLSEAFLYPDFNKFDRGKYEPIHYATMTEYDENYNCTVIFPKKKYQNSLGEVIANAGLKQMRIAETEKYPHVTYFFNVGVEKPFDGEDRVIVPSPKVATYDLKPEMSAAGVTDEYLKCADQYDLIILNYANPDMVGHTGSIKDAIKAVETVDYELSRLVKRTLEIGGKLLILADHGNCEYMQNPDGSPHTAHTTNLVHCVYVNEDHEQVSLKNGILADIAPTLLDMLGLEQPEEMTGNSLINRPFSMR